MTKGKSVLIVEHNLNSLSKINEGNSQYPNRLVTGGIFTQFNVTNRNNRFYTAENFIPAMNGLLERKELLGVIYGELDHPEGFDISGQNASHVIESLVWNKEEDRVDGSISILTTENGNKIRAIINDGYPIFVSSRAAGITGANNVVEIKELFTYDAVLDPGFANTRQSPLYESFGIDRNEKRMTSLNESLGYDNDITTPYRIYDVSESFDVETLTRDNNSDMKTYRDLLMMKQSMDNELIKMENNIMKSIKDQNTSPEEVAKTQEGYESLHEQITKLTTYLDHFKRNYNVLVKENKRLKKDINENTEYYNHISKGLQNVQKELSDLKGEINVVGKFAEHVANETHTAQKFTEHVASQVKENKKEIGVTQRFAEHVANETKITQKYAEHIANESKIIGEFAEHVANETKITQKYTEHIANESKIIGEFAENVANETKHAQDFSEYIATKLKENRDFSEYSAQEIQLTQGLLEHVAKHYKKDNYYIDYIANKLEGTINYIGENKVNESKKENIYDYLGINEEKELLNKVQNNITKQEVKINESKWKKFINEQTDGDLEVDFDATELPVEDTDNFHEDTESLSTQLLSSLVNILGTEETGIVLEITPDDKLIIKKTDSDETIELGREDVEVVNDVEDTEDVEDFDMDYEEDVEDFDMDYEEDVEDFDIVETVSKTLREIKKARAEANRQPHFFEFLSESEITNFKLLDNDTQKSIINEMEGSTYFSETDVLNIISEVINRDTRSYTEKLVDAMPKHLKDKWNSLEQNVKEGYIAESKFFSFDTTADMTSYWNTRHFAKHDDTITILNESVSNEENEDYEFSDEYIEAFRKSAMGK